MGGPSRRLIVMKAGRITGLVLALLLLSTPAMSVRAACMLGRLADLPVTMGASRTPVLPLKLNGTDTPFVVDSGEVLSMLTPQTVAALKLPPAVRARIKTLPPGVHWGIGLDGGRSPRSVSPGSTRRPW